MNLQSSVNKMGKTVTQIFIDINGNKKTYKGCIPESIEEGSHLKIMRTNGSMLLINTKLITITEVFPE